MAEVIFNHGVPGFQYGIAHLSRESERWKRRKCPIYDPGTSSKAIEDSILIPKEQLHLREDFINNISLGLFVKRS